MPAPNIVVTSEFIPPLHEVLEDIDRDLDRLIKQTVPDVLEKDIAPRMLAKMRPKMPRRSGQLRSSGRIVRRGDDVYIVFTVYPQSAVLRRSGAVMYNVAKRTTAAEIATAIARRLGF